MRGPFPFASRWAVEVTVDCFGAALITQAEEGAYDRRVSLSGVPAGASPFDGWLALLMKPIAPSFTDWCLRWLRLLDAPS